MDEVELVGRAEDVSPPPVTVKVPPLWVNEPAFWMLLGMLSSTHVGGPPVPGLAVASLEASPPPSALLAATT
jgi:hypothetical protein